MEACSPGEGLSRTPPGLGGILRETETKIQQLVYSNVFSRWTHGVQTSDV